MKKFRRIMALLLCLIMCLSVACVSVAAEEEEGFDGYVELLSAEGDELPFYLEQTGTVSGVLRLMAYREAEDDYVETAIPDNATYRYAVYDDERMDYIFESDDIPAAQGFSFTLDTEGMYTVEIYLDVNGATAQGYHFFYMGSTIPVDYCEAMTPEGDYLYDGAELLYTGKKLFKKVNLYCVLTDKYLVEGVDFECTLGNVKGPGTAMVIIDGLGKYTGELVMEIEIVSPSAEFIDVKQNGWYVGPVNYCLYNEYFNGVSDTHFAPEASMTRAMFVTVLGRVCGIDPGEYGTKTPFTDVVRTQYYARYVNWANENGIVNGMSATEFAPNANITREQMCTMILRMNGYLEQMANSFIEESFTQELDLTMLPDEEKFADDAAISSWAKQAVYACKGEGIVNGKPGNIFDPKGTATRAEVATIAQNYDEFYFERFADIMIID